MLWWWIQLSNQKCIKGSLWIISLLQWICGSWIQHCATCQQAIILKLQMTKYTIWGRTCQLLECWIRLLERWIYQGEEKFSFKTLPIILHFVKRLMLNRSWTSNKICRLTNIISLHSLQEDLPPERISMPTTKQSRTVSLQGRAISMILSLSLNDNRITTSIWPIERCSFSSKTS